MPPGMQTGIYFGWARLDGEGIVRKAVVSVGWNPYFKNKKKSFVSVSPWVPPWRPPIKSRVFFYFRRRTSFTTTAILFTAIG